MDEETELTGTTLRDAAVRSVDKPTMAKLEPLRDVFADGTVAVPVEARPAHWSHEKLTAQEFGTRWRAWQRSIGMGPENPE